MSANYRRMSKAKRLTLHDWAQHELLKYLIDPDASLIEKARLTEWAAQPLEPHELEIILANDHAPGEYGDQAYYQHIKKRSGYND